MNEKYIVFRVLRKVSDGSYIIDGSTKDSLNEAKHHFHSVMNTYAYGTNENYDYVMCMIQNTAGLILMTEVDNRISAPEPNAEA